MKNKILDEATRSMLDRARRYCATSEQCESGVRQKLIVWGAKPEMMDTIVARLRSEDYLNDKRFARVYCESKLLQQHWSRQKVLYQLRSKHLSKDDIEKGLSVVDDETYYGILAYEAGKKLKSLGGELTPDSQRKLYGFLNSRGYSTAEIAKAIDRGLPTED